MVELVFVGAVRRRGRLVYMYGRISQDGTALGTEGMVYPRPITDDPPGSRLELQADEDDDRELYLDTARFLGTWPDGPEVAAWRAAHDAIMAGQQAQDAPAADGLEDQLRPIRTAYMGLSAPERAILLSQVVLHITGEAD